MKEIFKKSTKLFAYLICAGIMCCFTYLSFNVIFNFAFTEQSGYDVYGYTEENPEKELLYTFLYEENGGKENVEDKEWKAYEEKGYTLEKITKRTTLSKGANNALVIITQIFSLIFAASFVTDVLLTLGNKDNNLVRIKSKKEDKLKGLKIGLMASAPAYLLLLVTVICAKGLKPGIPIQVFKILNGVFWPTFDALLGSAKVIGDILIWQYIVIFIILSIIPVIGFFAYFVGYKDYAILSKLLYKKNKKKD
ncbi:MAG: hypothetical protein IKK24_00545 [Clostridia bacterium]|nr:hypothetical protein [Clostridia bacterium]